MCVQVTRIPHNPIMEQGWGPPEMVGLSFPSPHPHSMPTRGGDEELQLSLVHIPEQKNNNQDFKYLPKANL